MGQGHPVCILEKYIKKFILIFNKNAIIGNLYHIPGSTSASDQHCTDVVSRHTSMSGQCWQPTSFPYGSRSRSDIEAMSVNDIVPTLLRHLFYIFPTACRYSADINTMFFQCCPDTKYDTYPTPIRRCSYSLTTLRLQFG